jgi:DNA-binding XRE family transcriptional regulator
MKTASSTKETKAVDLHVGSRVRMRRMMLGMSQEKLGDVLGLTFQQVQKCEKGTNRISASLALAKAFMRIENAKLRRLIVHLVEDCANL